MAENASRSLKVALLVAGAFFMENLDGTVITTALPQMARSFGTDAVSLNIGITAYLVALAVFIPISGWVADRFGARRVFAVAIAAFTITSVLCGIGDGIWQFTLARVLQGIAGAMMVPVGRLAVLRTTDKGDLMRAIATITWPGLAAPIIGPPLGGFITKVASWRWIFFLNLPLGLIALALALLWIPREDSHDARPFDVPGFLLTGVACGTLLAGFDLIGQRPIPWNWVVGLLAVGFTTGAAAVGHAKRAEHPLVDLWALRIPTFAINIWGGSFFRIAIGGAPFLLPLLYQEAFGWDAFRSGLIVLAVFAGNLSMKPATTFVLRRFGFRQALVVNGIVTAILIAVCALFSPATPFWLMFVILFLGGLGRSMQFTSYNTIMFADVPEARMSGANALASTVGQLTFAMGVALGAVMLRLAGLRHPEHVNPTLADFQVAFLVLGVLGLLSIFDCVGLPANAGEAVSGRSRRVAPQK